MTNKLYGITHDAASGNAMIRVPRAIKISIGKPAGNALHVYIPKTPEDEPAKWVLEIGSGNEAKAEVFGSKEECKHRYYELKKNGSPKRKFPEKLDYFTFMRPSALADGTLEPEFDTIERHGATPRKIDIVFTDDDPFSTHYEMYGGKGLLCRGDGIDALRSVEWPQSQEEQRLAAEAKANNRTTFAIKQCFTNGCQFATKDARGNRQCTAHGRLALQLVNDIRLGARAQYDTTGIKTTSQIFSSLFELATFTGGGRPEDGYVRGIPLRMGIYPFKTNHEGKPGRAYAVSLEFRADSLQGLQAKLSEFSKNFSARPVEAPATKLIAASSSPEEDGEDVTPEEAAIIQAEFAAGEMADDEIEEDPEMQAAPTMESNTAAATEALKGRITEAPEPIREQARTTTAKPFSIGVKR